MTTPDSDPDYMALLKEFQEMAKIPKPDSKDRATVMLATVEEYRADHPKLASHQRRMLDHIENSCRTRLGMPPLQKSMFQKILDKF